MTRKYFLYIWLSICCVSCFPSRPKESQQVVTQADSLRAEGQMYSDSMQLAQAYMTLGQWQWCYADAFAHVCYHYGRLLRKKEDPVSAMKVFINATHSRTHDYHILGRVYSNMGSICHLAGEFSLSCDMYEKSAEMFLYSKDSIAYYYALNDMAFEKAMQADTIDCFILINKIKDECTDVNILTKLLETKAEAYYRVKQYNSALKFACQLCNISSRYPLGKLIKAQVYSIYGQKDSATYYAKQVLLYSSDISDIHNALYILTNDDEERDKDAVRETAACRADIQKILEIRKGKLAQAAQLLEQEIRRKPNWTWLYAIIVTLLVVSIFLYAYIYRKRKKYLLLSQQIDNLENKNKAHIEHIMAQMEERCSILASSPNIKEELCWKNYDQMCAIVNIRLLGVINRLQSYSLSEKEIRLCVLVLLKASTEQMIDMIPYSHSGIGKFKYTTARKLGTKTENIRHFLINLVC